MKKTFVFSNTFRWSSLFYLVGKFKWLGKLNLWNLNIFGKTFCFHHLFSEHSYSARWKSKSDGSQSGTKKKNPRCSSPISSLVCGDDGGGDRWFWSGGPTACWFIFVTPFQTMTNCTRDLKTLLYSAHRCAIYIPPIVFTWSMMELITSRELNFNIFCKALMFLFLSFWCQPDSASSLLVL